MSDANTSPGPLERADARWDSLTGASAQPVIVLERVARAAGRTNWFACRTAAEYAEIEPGFLPGSKVSAYFDGRLSFHRYDDSVRAEILRIARRDHDCVVAVLGAAPPRLEVEFIAGAGELDEFEETLGDLSEVCFGAYPGDDNDGMNALTWTVPDADGVVRTHPH
ncbi:hypothetical protein R6V09_08185 [Streptomyces sp. W16]|uniref:hypothetical protein n=1 Tax=Streptomyces sp. W16 TaxID=3076631 RepID=UPI00295B7140|nr:hypothetical protein [Streptomyces sp. W16]MDV9170118.1 hypothetical protein [Streptomyces sp. W16]